MGPEQVLVVALHAVNGRVNDVGVMAIQSENGVVNAVDGELPGGGLANDASFADGLAAGLELRLDQEDGASLPMLTLRCEGGEDGGENEGGRD
jgi:hypothetical protein